MTTQPPPAPDTPDATERESEQSLDTMARFRAALERKQNRQQSGGEGVFADPQAHGDRRAAAGRREFRRKSG